MGSIESLPDRTAFEHRHHVSSQIPLIAKLVPPAGPAEDHSIQLIVKEKLWSWSGDRFKIKTRSGESFAGLQIQGNSLTKRDRVTLMNETKQLVAVCRRKFKSVGDTFEILTTQPLYVEQLPSDQKYEGVKLYTYCKVERGPFSTEQRVTMANESSASYTINRAGSLKPKNRVVKRHGIPAALMEGGKWEGDWNSYLLTINPGIDPCLIICLCAVYKDMYERKQLVVV